MEKRQSIQVDVSRFRNYVDTLFFKQNDVNVYPVEIKLQEDGEPFDLSDVTRISFINETPISKSVVEGPCTILDAAAGKMERLFGTNEIAEYGEAKAEIKLFSGEKLLSSATFSYFIERTLYTDETVQSTIEYTTLQQALIEVDNALDNAEERIDVAIQEAKEQVDDAISILPSSVMKTWRPLINVAVGQVMYPTDPASPLAFECIQAGTTGTTEPTGTKMQAITDGTARWGIFDIRLRRLEIEGTSKFRNWTTPKKGYKVSNGATLTNLSINYPSLYRALQGGEVPLLTTSAWATMSTSRNNGIGGVPYFGYDGGDTCILPDVRDMTFKASGTHEVGAYHGDAIRNITGQAGIGALSGFSYGTASSGYSGVISAIGSGTVGGHTASIGTNNYGIKINIADQVPTADENRVKAIMQLPVIFVGYEGV